MRNLDIQKLEKNINEIALYDIKNNNVFGSSYFVMQKGGITFKKHFGNTGAGKSAKVNDGTLYRLASMTKPITAAAILILIDRGLISLNDPVSKFIGSFEDIHIITPDGTDFGKTNKPVTVLNCLCHTSGFGSGKNVSMTERDRATIYSTIDRYVSSGLEFEPGTSMNYSPYAAFDVLAAIVEKVTDQKYDDFLKNEIFIPCNMPDTTFSPSKEQSARLMTMHNKANNTSVVGVTHPHCIFEDFPFEHNLAGAGLASTLNDYSNFARMLLNKGKINRHRILSESICSRFSVPCVLKEFSPGENWGLGVRVITNKTNSRLSVGSFGWSGAYGSHFWIDPMNQIGAVYMKNSKVDGGSGNCSAVKFEQAVYDSII